MPPLAVGAARPAEIRRGRRRSRPGERWERSSGSPRVGLCPELGSGCPRDGARQWMTASPAVARGSGEGGDARMAMCDSGWCYGSWGSYSRARWPRGEQGDGLPGGGHGSGGVAGAGSGGVRRRGGHLNRGGSTNGGDDVMSRP
jgi:hypothetical protein